jgi:hypothetical protein
MIAQTVQLLTAHFIGTKRNNYNIGIDGHSTCTEFNVISVKPTLQGINK